MILACPLAAHAQNAPPVIIAHLEGRDISCESGTPETGRLSSVGTRLDVSDGTVVTVHSGQARMTLLAGGLVDVCGPAKMTVLLTGDAITLALNFGRVRVSLPDKTALRIFTPTIIGTPLDISGGARDVTVGLSLDDSLCVVATSGAIQLEHQFTGERLIVPQAGEFFLNAGKLVPVAGTPGSCRCSAAEPFGPTIPPSPEYAAVTPSAIPPGAAGSAADPAPAAGQPEAVERNIDMGVLAQVNAKHPVSPKTKQARPVTPPSSSPVYTAVLPALTFMAGSPAAPPEPAADIVMLVREARVSPDWEFTGHVEPPEFAQAMQHALGETTGTGAAGPGAATNDPNPPAAQPAPKKKGGFWASLKRVFGGWSEN